MRNPEKIYKGVDRAQGFGLQAVVGLFWGSKGSFPGSFKGVSRGFNKALSASSGLGLL